VKYTTNNNLTQNFIILIYSTLFCEAKFQVNKYNMASDIVQYDITAPTFQLQKICKTDIHPASHISQMGKRITVT